jgi:hypothetical protein
MEVVEITGNTDLLRFADLQNRPLPLTDLQTWSGQAGIKTYNHRSAAGIHRYY